MYGDAEVIRRRSMALAEQAVEVRALADRMSAGAETVAWPGRAAADLQERMLARAAQLRDAAALHDTAAEALARHARATADATETIADAERRFAERRAVAQAHRADLDARTGDGVERELADEDQAVLSAQPPPPGHRGWLTWEPTTTEAGEDR